LAAIRKNDQGVGPEELGDGVLVVAQIAGKGGLQSAVSSFQLDEHQWKTIDEAHQVGPASVHFARDPELRTEQKVVVGRLVPIHNSHQLDRLAVSLGIGRGDVYSVLDKVVDRAVGGHHAHARTVTG